MSGLMLRGAAGKSWTCFMAMLTGFSPSKGRPPVAISYITTPSEYRSEAASTGCPWPVRARSSAPCPGSSRLRSWSTAPPARAMPKSVTFTRPSSSMMMFCGLMSRWMTSRRCAKRSASRICTGHRDQQFRAQRRVLDDDLLEGPALEVLHRYVVGALGLAPVVDLDDVRVVEAGRVARLAAEALDELLVVGVVREEGP